jgi:hypothetical protein
MPEMLLGSQKAMAVLELAEWIIHPPVGGFHRSPRPVPQQAEPSHELDPLVVVVIGSESPVRNAADSAGRGSTASRLIKISIAGHSP